MIYKAASVAEAVEMAREMKRAGTYSLFRGQRRDWPVKTTLARTPDEDRPAALEAFERFVGFLKTQAETQPFADHVDTVFAIAQHYHMPTQYLDFSTDPAVAGFFASGGEAVADEESCIILLNPEDLLDFWKAMPSRYPPPELITIDVPNLWRLEAQKGVFLFCQYPDIDIRIYRFDRILFPSGGTVDSPTHDEIYPRKSALEILLDHYFMNESMLRNERLLRGLLSKFTHIPVHDDGDVDSEVIIGGGPPSEPSWSSDTIAEWRSMPREVFSDAYTTQRLSLLVRSTDAITAHAETAYQMLKILRDQRDVRSRLVKFDVLVNGAPESVTNLAPFIERLWDGLRSLPYDDLELAESVGALVGIALASGRPGQYLDDIVAYPGETIELELGSDDGSYTRAFAPPSELLDAVRTDIEILEWVRPEYIEAVHGHIVPMLQFIRRPDLLFAFDAFRLVFARWIIPSQILLRQQSDASGTFRRAIFYNPARLTRFGLP